MICFVLLILYSMTFSHLYCAQQYKSNAALASLYALCSFPGNWILHFNFSFTRSFNFLGHSIPSSNLTFVNGSYFAVSWVLYYGCVILSAYNHFSVHVQPTLYPSLFPKLFVDMIQYQSAVRCSNLNWYYTKKKNCYHCNFRPLLVLLFASSFLVQYQKQMFFSPLLQMLVWQRYPTSPCNPNQ